MKKVLPTQKQLLEMLRYDPESGFLFWLHRGDGPGLKYRTGMKAGHIRDDGYMHIGIWRRQHYVHRVIWCMQTGVWPKLQIDHKNLNRADNRWSNLRLSTPSQNKANIRSLNRLGIKGVAETRNGKFRASIGVNRKCIQLGTFETKDEAKAAYAAAAKKHFGEFARFE